MASVPVLNQSGKKAGTRELPSEWFEAPVNGPLMHQVVEKSFRNIPTVMVTYARSVPVYALLEADRVLFTAGALDALEGSAETEPDEREQADETETSGDESQAEAGEADEADEQD